MLPLISQRTTSDRLYFEAPYTVAVRRENLPVPGLNEVRVNTHMSAVSAGTELLFYRGQAPAEMALDSTLASLSGACNYPLRYGYACVGTVAAAGAGAGRSWIGQRVFVFEPHASAFITPVDALIPVADDLSDEVAALLPSSETATNLVLDGAPRLGERVAVFGAGVIGLLTTAWLARFPLAELVVIEPNAERRARALHMGASAAHASATEAGGGGALRNFDLVYELSGNPAALNGAIHSAGFGARVVVGSWYGAKQAPLDLGGHFHRNRIELTSSQVSTLSPSLTGRWDKGRRIAQAWQLLRTTDATSLITHRWPFADAANAYRLIDQQPATVLQLLFSYDALPRESVG